MLTLPNIVANPPEQPFYPTVALKNVQGMALWASLHDSLRFRNAQNIDAIPARAPEGAVPVTGTTLLTERPRFIETEFPNGRAYTVFDKLGVTASDYMMATVRYSGTWNTVVAIGRQRNTNREMWALWPDGTAAGTQVFFDPRHNASSAELAHQGNSVFTGATAQPLGTFGIFICAFNFATGEVKVSMGAGNLVTGSLPSLPDIVLPENLTGTLTIGCRQRNMPFDGPIPEVGLIRGDLFADAEGLATIRNFSQQMYGIS